MKYENRQIVCVVARCPINSRFAGPHPVAAVARGADEQTNALRPPAAQTGRGGGGSFSGRCTAAAAAQLGRGSCRGGGIRALVRRRGSPCLGALRAPRAVVRARTDAGPVGGRCARRSAGELFQIRWGCLWMEPGLGAAGGNTAQRSTTLQDCMHAARSEGRGSEGGRRG
jgi:hypothetical protein